MIKYLPVFVVLLCASSAQAQHWEWRRQPVTAEDYCEIKRIARLTPLPKSDLDSVLDSERIAFNNQTMQQYNQVLPIPLPMMPTPDVATPPRRGIVWFFRQK